MSDYTLSTPGEAALTRRLKAFDRNLAELRSELEAVAAKYAAIKERLDRPPIILYTPLDLLRWIADGDLRMTEEGWIYRGWKIEPDRDGIVQWMGTEEGYGGPPDHVFTGDTPDEVLELIVDHEEGEAMSDHREDVLSQASKDPYWQKIHESYGRILRDLETEPLPIPSLDGFVGYYSEGQRRRTKHANIYLNPDGEEVLVTDVRRSTSPPPNFGDVKGVGPVSKHVRMIRDEGYEASPNMRFR